MFFHSTVLAVMMTVGLFAGSIDETYNNYNQAPTGQDCGTFDLPGACQPLDFTLPQFDPNLGTLDSITWTFTGGQMLYIDIDDCEGPFPLAYSYTTTAGVTSTMLGLNAGRTSAASGVISAPRCAGLSDFTQGDFMSSSGTVSDATLFSGPGEVNIAIWPYVSGSLTQGGAVGFDVDGEELGGTLYLTYGYTSVVPEPWLPAFTMIGGGFIVLAHRRKLFRQLHPSILH